MHKQPAPWIVVTGLDGSGKSTLVRALAKRFGGRRFRLPLHRFVKRYLRVSGGGTPLGDVHTDRLLFAADARLANAAIARWRAQHTLLISQRGWMDGFVFGAVQGVCYHEVEALQRTAELERPSAIITLIADPDVAFGRIRFDPHADKFETLAFLRAQHRETLRFREAVSAGLPILSAFAGIPEILIDTTQAPPGAVPPEALALVEQTLAPAPAPSG